jgi:hypothetical protein
MVIWIVRHDSPLEEWPKPELERQYLFCWEILPPFGAKENPRSNDLFISILPDDLNVSDARRLPVIVFSGG